MPASERYDYQQPTIKDITWVWRGEEDVRSVMVITGEADVGGVISKTVVYETTLRLLVLGYKEALQVKLPGALTEGSKHEEC